ncbi:2,3-bisphosphoglycerate-independent phosphoglycerate mutase [Vaginella massiliensis]|uniref:2,3-bisphosphoglycerate-independent phosphoglycerate mutase n=1 Tax=Vaginella massiliensis TaxID=1816680 RepID=UPI0008391CE6|nr:2,3-bisphosphoglycerate-independent phosphoglycerate mutase [Vaginella massiliensis]
MTNKAILLILDGWGIYPDPEVSAIEKAKTPNIDRLISQYPNNTLDTFGLAVGLPEGQMGNSEVGHMNLGAGRVVFQNLVRINMAVEQHTLLQEPVLKQAFQYALDHSKKVHFIGLVSDGGVHSHINHLKGLLSAAHEFGLQQNVFVHAFTDGRDCDPTSGIGFITALQEHMQQTIGELASVTGRYYAMDRDQRWERVKLAYDAMVHGLGERTQNVTAAIQNAYDAQITDEFLKPIIHTDEGGNPIAIIENDDVVICFNFRTDRGREITEVLTQRDFPEFQMFKLNLNYITMTEYDKTFEGVKIIFDDGMISNTLGEVLESNGKKQIRIAETEKYPHVTFFFSGGREVEFQGEKRILKPSPRDVATYDLKPEMSAYDLTNEIIPEIEQESADFICMNFANTDMVGHTGVFEAAVKAAEVVDECVGRIVQTALEHDYTLFILADHGNSDYMKNPDGSPNTQHSTNQVPLIVVDRHKHWHVSHGKLGDIAPSILHVMNISIPSEMTGNIIVT